MISAHDEFNVSLTRSIELYDHSYYEEAATEILNLIKQCKRQDKEFAHLLEFLAVIYTEQGKFAEAELLFDDAILAINKLSNNCKITSKIGLLNTKAGLYHSWGDFDKAQLLYRQALEILDTEFGDSGVKQLHIHIVCNYSDLLIRQGRLTEAKELIADGNRLNEGLADTEAQLALNHNLGFLYLANGQPKECIEIVEKLISEMDSSHRHFAKVLTTLATAKARAGQCEDAEVLCRRILDLNGITIGASHKDNANILNLLAELFLLQKRYKDAEKACNQALKIINHNLGLYHQQAAAVLLNLASAQIGLGNNDGIASILNWALDITKGDKKGGALACRQQLHQLGLLFHQRRMFKEAKTFYLQALGLTQQIFGQSHTCTITVLTDLALCEYQLFEHQLAEAHAGEAAALLFGLDETCLDYNMIGTLEMLAELLLAFKCYASAQAIYNGANILLSTHLSKYGINRFQLNHGHQDGLLISSDLEFEYSQTVRTQYSAA